MSITTNPVLSRERGSEIKRRSRRAFARLNRGQRHQLRSEYRFLRRGHQMAPYQAAGIIRRMADMATWR